MTRASSSYSYLFRLRAGISTKTSMTAGNSRRRCIGGVYWAGQPGRAAPVPPSDARYTRRVDVLDAIGRVRTVRAYTAEPIDPAILRRIVDAGRHAGSSKNLQRWG